MVLTLPSLSRLTRRSLLAGTAMLAATHLGCSTPKEAASDAMGPEATIHTVPEGADLQLGGQPLGKAPIGLPIHRSDKSLDFTATREGYFPTKASVDAAAFYTAGGGDLWIALKPVSMGEASGPLDPSSAADVDRAGVSVGKAGHCDDALQFFARAQAMDPSLARVFRDRAHCLFKLHRREEGLNELDKYVLAAPDAPDTQKVSEEVAKGRAGRDFDSDWSTGGRK